MAEIQWYSQFEQARLEILAAHGLKAVIGCFALGTPDVTNPDVSLHESLRVYLFAWAIAFKLFSYLPDLQGNQSILPSYPVSYGPWWVAWLT